jgi:hypothetical protein
MNILNPQLNRLAPVVGEQQAKRIIAPDRQRVCAQRIARFNQQRFTVREFSGVGQRVIKMRRIASLSAVNSASASSERMSATSSFNSPASFTACISGKSLAPPHQS